MATDIAANSDSTLTYSHGASSPLRTLSESASTMWVWGEIGYAQITSGRHSATASATACEPSFCSSMCQLLRLAFDQLVCGRRGGGVAVGQATGELPANGRGYGLERDQAAERG